MYNRYIPNGAVYTRIPVEEEKTTSRVRPSEGSPPTDGPERAPGGLPFSIASLLGSGAGKGGGLTGLLRSLKLDRLDSGDILLLLIVLLLLWEGDDLELVIALGLALIMGLGDEEEAEMVIAPRQPRLPRLFPAIPCGAPGHLEAQKRPWRDRGSGPVHRRSCGIPVLR